MLIFVDMFAPASSILCAVRIRNAEKALRTETLATQVIHLGLFFERKKEKEKKERRRHLLGDGLMIPLRFW